MHHTTNTAYINTHYTVNSIETDSLISILWVSDITTISFRGSNRTHTENEELFTLVEKIRPRIDTYVVGIVGTVVCVLKITASTGKCTLYYASSYPAGRIYFSTTFLTA